MLVEHIRPVEMLLHHVGGTFDVPCFDQVDDHGTMAENVIDRKRDGRRARHSRKAVSFEPTVAGTLGGMYKSLSERGIQRIHEAALDVLATVGMKDATPVVRDLALARGCTLDNAGRLLFPRGLVEEIIAGAAREFTLYGQTPEHDIEARAGRVHFATGGAAIKMLDSRTG